MSEETETPAPEPTAPVPPSPSTPPAPSAPPTPPQPLTYDELLAERDRWQRAATEAQASQASAAEQAAQAARGEVLSQLGPELINTALRLQATTEGVELPNPEYLALDRFAGEDGRPDTEAIQKFVTSLPKSRPAFPQLGGTQVSPGGGASMANMDPEALADLIAGNSII
ncbi:hypothetical protein C9F11_10130 [Streptomyces sp. YIM 121038]|uniref:hypothetical protein n=1 Tax=Streptomyces sp. YIM 121038 TaxID=2136401 RepID=UPI001110AEC4|nr:hypothetical protein [Streptomyces sp. YIM 121038]QCX75706.1 hypothetical protein C9F11_10130 [Streptomyces sp. YIM 121038]